MIGPLAWYRAWRQRRADEKIIQASLKFMGKWSAYQQRQSEKEQPGTVPRFAEKVEQLKRQMRKNG